MHCFLVFPFFSSIWQMYNIRLVVDLLRQNPHWWSQIIFSAYGLNLGSRMLDKICSYLMKVMCLNNYQNLFINLKHNYHDRLLPVLQWILIIPSRCNKFKDLGASFPNIWFNLLNPELNPICYLLALIGAPHFLHVSRIRVKLLTFRLLMSYIYGAPILDVSRSHTRTQYSR